MSIKVAVYDAKPYDRDSLQGAEDSGKIDWIFYSFRLNADTAITAHGADAVCVFVNDHVDAETLKILSDAHIHHIALRCAGFNNVDVEKAHELGIQLTRVPAYSPYAVAEHTVALLMTLNRKIHRSFNRVRELNFSLSGLVGVDLHGRTAGVIGTGKIGVLTAQIFKGYGMRVLAYDPYPQTEWAREVGVEYVELHELFAQSDVLSLHVPLLAETHHMINRESLSLMKNSAILLNVSRGALVDTPALIEALKAGNLGGVGLDVYEEEEGIFFEDLSGQVLQDDDLARLLTFPNVLITSHQAFLTHEALHEISRVSIENILRLKNGQEALEGTRLE